MKTTHEKSCINTHLDAVAVCTRSYDPMTGLNPARDEIFTAGQTYSCRSKCDGWTEVEDNFGVLHDMPSAAFLSYFRFL